MRNLKSGQLKALSEFLNTVAAAWFSVGVIAPLFTRPDDFSKILLPTSTAIALTVIFLVLSLYSVRKVKL